jgi:hypothetical protein
MSSSFSSLLFYFSLSNAFYSAVYTQIVTFFFVFIACRIFLSSLTLNTIFSIFYTIDQTDLLHLSAVPQYHILAIMC